MLAVKVLCVMMVTNALKGMMNSAFGPTISATARSMVLKPNIGFIILFQEVVETNTCPPRAILNNTIPLLVYVGVPTIILFACDVMHHESSG